MPSQYDDSEEVSKSFFHDVMTVITRRFVQLLIKQEERQAKLFAELFGDAAVGVSKRPEDVAEQTVSLCVRKSDLDGRLECEAPEYKGLVLRRHLFRQLYSTQRQNRATTTRWEIGREGRREEMLAGFGDVDVSVEQSTDVLSDNDLHVSVLPSGLWSLVKLWVGSWRRTRWR